MSDHPLFGFRSEDETHYGNSTRTVFFDSSENVLTVRVEGKGFDGISETKHYLLTEVKQVWQTVEA